MGVSTDIDVAPRLTKTDQVELDTIFALTAREREWYAAHPHFGSEADIADAFAEERIVEVGPDDNIMPIYRLRTMPDEYPPYLLPSSAAAVGAIGRLWRSRLAVHDIDAPDVRLPITSMVRTELMQQALVKAGALAVAGSTHCAGAAFDIDASSYYMIAQDGLPLSVPDPRRDIEKAHKIADFLIARSPETGALPMRVADHGSFDSRITSALLVTTLELERGGYINRIVEFRKTPNQCLHIAPNPDVSADEWATMVA